MEKIMRARAFALPSIMIASVVMLMVLAAAISGVATTRTALTDQYYNQIAKEAAESGLAMADACIKGGTLTWPNPLRPGSDCSGAATQCSDDSCYLLKEGNIRTTFYVDAPTNPGDTSTANAVGRVELTRTSNSAVWKSYSQDISKLEQGEGRKLTWKAGSLSVGSYHACAIANNDNAYCWGANSSGQLGNGSNSASSVPVAVSTAGVLSGKKILAIAAGSSHTCAIASDSLAYCWGFGIGGALGNGSGTSSSVPVAVTTSGVLSGKVVNQIASGTNYSCVVASDGLPYCWGSAFSGSLGNGSTNDQDSPVAVTTSGVLSGKTVNQIVAGDLTTCVVASDYKAYCWGNNGSSGTFGNGTTSPSQSSVPVAAASTGGLSGKNIDYIDTDGYTACAIAVDNRLTYCWGGNYAGQMGNNSTTSSANPVAVTTSGVLSGKTTETLDVGDNFYSHTCAVASDNRAYCWGYNNHGQLGDNTTTNRLTAVAVEGGAIPNDTSIRQIGAGNEFTCAIAADANIYCWGSNFAGQLGNGSTSDSSIPVRVAAANDVSSGPQASRQIIAGSGATCSLASNDKLYCWGSNYAGAIGDNTATQRLSPVASLQGDMPGSGTVRQVMIGGGSASTCAIASNNKAYCWGSASQGQRGDGTTTGDRYTPGPVLQGAMPAGATIRQLAAGNLFACAIASDNKVYCWGYNSQGHLGDNTTTNRSTPVAVLQGAMPAGAAVQQITGGTQHACAIAANNNRAYCWGYNLSGQLGDGTTDNSRYTPVLVAQGAMPAGAAIRQISGGNAHTCAIASSNNRVYCWGNNFQSQLGDGTTTNRPTPVLVLQGAMPAGAAVRQIAVGHYHSCAITFNNKVYCWGRNEQGQLGDGTTTNRSSPIAVLQGAMPAGAIILQVAVNHSSSCVIASNAKTYCWGGNAQGQLGDNSTTTRLAPVEVRQLPLFSVVQHRTLYY